MKKDKVKFLKTLEIENRVNNIHLKISLKFENEVLKKNFIFRYIY